MSSTLWDSRFSEDSSADLSQGQEEEQDFDVGQVLAETRSVLPFMSPDSLKSDGHLGRGTSFQVNRELFTKPRTEPYYVAVKHMLIKDRSREELHRLYNNVTREIRVLTHPPLRDHPCIIRALAYGWTSDPRASALPYLVVEFSGHGTLPQYLHRCNIPLRERRELALDVAAGIEALHKCGFIHGDIKPENVLVFDTGDDFVGDSFIERPQVARLADFGCALSRTEIVEKRVRPWGTEKYNAPEIQNRLHSNTGEPTDSFELFAKSDVYSFGLCLWEVIKNGESYVDKNWLFKGEKEQDLHSRLWGHEEDELLRRAIKYCVILREGDEPDCEELSGVVENTLIAALRDDPVKRCGIEEIFQRLSRGTRKERPSSTFPPSRNLVPHGFPELEQLPPASPRQTTFHRLVPELSTRSDFKFISSSGTSSVNSNEHKGMVAFRGPPAQKAQAFSHQALNLFEISMATLPPWEVQVRTSKKLQERVYDSDSIVRGAALLQLSICYYLGFGIRPDHEETIRYLELASPSNPTAQAIKDRIRLALQGDAEGLNTDTNLDTALLSSYFSRRVCKSQRQGKPTDIESSLMRTLVYARPDALEDLLAQPEVDGATLSEALTTACKYGRYEAAKTLASRCLCYVSGSPGPTPLHWMIMFEATEADTLATILIEGSSASASHKGLCAEMLDTIVEAPIILPEHCMELCGTPLHWAVRTRNLPLVQTFLRLGADLQTRWKGRRVFHDEPNQVETPNYSPLDIAVSFHYPEVVEYLIQRGASVMGTHIDDHSVFHFVGHTTRPFARLVCHGGNHRSAVESTIQVLCKHGLDINEKNVYGFAALHTALASSTSDQYIVEELIKAGANSHSIHAFDDRNLASFVTIGCADRPFDSWRLSLVLDLVTDLQKTDRLGRNALHYAAIGGSADMIEVLLKSGRVDVDAKAGDELQNTALLYATMFGRSEATQVLIKWNAAKELSNLDGETPLEQAVLCRRVRTVSILIKSGAELRFRPRDGVPRSTILHAAVSGASSRTRLSIVQDLLAEHQSLRDSSFLDTFTLMGWTPLHKAAYFGDVHGVKALVLAGANWKLAKLRSPSPTTGTPLEICEKAIHKLEDKGPSQDYVWLKDRNPLAIKEFKNHLEEIKDFLKDPEWHLSRTA